MSRETFDYENDPLVDRIDASRDDAPLAADTYHRGMPLSFNPAVTAGGTNTGDGTLTVESGIPAQDYVVEMTAALVAKLTVDSVDVLTGIALPDGGSVRIEYDGVTLVLTDGATAFVAGDDFTVSSDSGSYGYDDVNIESVYNGVDGRILSSAGVGSIIQAGILKDEGFVDDSGATLTITDAMRLNAEKNNIYIK